MSTKFYGAASLAVIAFASASQSAMAQSAAPESTTASSVEEVVVTGSRVSRVGFTAPTPVTAVSTEQLKTASPGNIGEALRQLPILSASSGARGATGSSGNGGSFLNLRNLGASRTLTLLDGRRFVATSNTGTVDAALFPQALVSRVEIVTGGASAAYGSDAVAGVVNFILDKDYTGFKGEVMAGVADEGDDDEQKLSLTGGGDFAGRGHFLISGEAYRNAGLYDVQQREWGRRGCLPINNPAGPPARIFACDVRSSNGNFAGLISTGPLRGITFDNNSNPIPFDFGTLTTSTTQVGGDGVLTQFVPLVVPAKRASLFSRVSWEFNDHLNGYLEANYGAAEYQYQVGSYSQTLGTSALTIYRDNAFITPEFRNMLLASNVQSFRLGRYSRDLPRTHISNLNYTTRVVAGLDGNFGGVKWQAYYQHGENRRAVDAIHSQNLDKYQEASDAVFAPDGSVVCRSTLTHPGNGCVPVNVLGEHLLTEAQINYVTGTSWTTGKTTEDVAAFEFNAEPFSIPAGPVSIAAGAEYRKEALHAVGDPLSTVFSVSSNAQGPYRLGNYLSQDGEFDVKEAFVETVVPIAKDMPLIQSLDFNGAVRRTDYSTSGGVTTWKLGLTYRPFDFIRFRGTRSRDIRAPNLNELFNAGTVNRAPTFLDQYYDPPRTLTAVLQIGRGNPNLKPEVADTLTFGAVITPTFVPNLDISVDAYDIKIAGAIATVNATQSTLDCRNGSAQACSQVERDANGTITTIYNIPVNLQVLKASGVDIEAAYHFSLEQLSDSLPGDVNLRFLGTYVRHNYSVAPGALTIDRTGDISQPKWRWNLQGTYRNGPWGLAVSSRYTGSGPYDSSTSATDLPQKKIPGQVLTDARISYDAEAMGGHYTLYLNVQDITNQEPPVFAAQYVPENFDSVGRYFRMGVTFQY